MATMNAMNKNYKRTNAIRLALQNSTNTAIQYPIDTDYDYNGSKTQIIKVLGEEYTRARCIEQHASMLYDRISHNATLNHNFLQSTWKG